MRIVIISLSRSLCMQMDVYAAEPVRPSTDKRRNFENCIFMKNLICWPHMAIDGADKKEVSGKMVRNFASPWSLTFCLTE